MSEPWLTVLGIGEDGRAGLSPAAQACLDAAHIVFGGRRHLALAGVAHGRTWPSPFERGVEEVLALRGRPVCVLASGDPFLHGVGATLARRVPAQEMRVLPAPSAFSLAAARLGWALHEVDSLSLHGRPLELVRPHLQPGRRLLALTSDGQGPAMLAALLAAGGFGASRLHVLEALGGPRERVRTAPAAGFALDDIDPLNLVGIEVAAAPGARILPRTAGRAEALFEHDGQITKREVRAVTLAALAPRRGEMLWHIGAGSGSIGIEWLLADPSLRALAVEARADRAARIARNALACGVPGLTVVQGEAPAALAGLPGPDAVFVGGGASEAVLDAAIGALQSGGRLVVNAVTLETEALLIARYGALGGDLVQIAVARAAPVGGFSGWSPFRPVTQWSWIKP
ncbi:MAG TPA: precorrin-6y C5,15-methyltransferase (decarboxylating) subunit CbiE [Xanthobacteraceae bacterium]|nr:precorrin-6y C5,15-methyltransferase (decarboxylating) subunit CbiE [Xanthobacteraceae bacterium]